ncbi:MAG: ATP-binding protein, partial [Thermomicrobiales bacterium]
LAIARDRLRQADTRANQHNSLRLEETAQKGSYERSLAEIEAIKAQIAELDAATLQVDSLTPLAESASTLQERLQEHERARKQSDAIAEAGRQLETLEKTAGQIRLSIHDVKSRISEERAPLQIEEPGSVDVLSEIANLLTIALSRDTDGLQAQLSALERCIGLSTAAANEQKRLTSYLERAGHIETELREILANGDPAKDVETAVTAAGEARKAESAARARLAEDEKQRARLESLSARLASGQFDEPCPTCGRPYDPAAIEQDLLALRVQIETLSENIQRGISEAEEAATKAVLAEQQEASARKRLQQLAHCKSRLEQSGPHIEEAREACALASSALSAALHATGRDTVPSGDDIDAVRAELLTAQRQQQEVPLLEALRRDYQLNAGQIEAARAHRINLGADTYDRSAHAADTEAWRSASDASAQIAVLLQRIASRQAVQDRLSAAETRSRSIAGEIEKTQEAIRLLAFSPEEHAAARDAEQAEREHYERLLHEQHELKSLLTAAENALIGIDAEETRLKALLQSSIDAHVAADELDRMYREFSRFEQYVARAVTPALAEITSQLVSAVTEGKYDRVEFSEDFGIEVFDGDDDHFPLSQFSGGERDVIALCARLALSQFLGGQSGSPPQFVVMDEVFGSLDKTRRENLMDTLNRLVDDSGAFRQLFVISHVDDVRASTAFDEVWRVEEGPDGSSQLEQLSSGSVPVDL